MIEYCEKHVEAKYSLDETIKENVRTLDAKLMKVNQLTFFDLINVADYFGIPSLIDLAFQKVAGLIEGKIIDKLRETFNVKNDLTPEEEERVRKENIWAFEWTNQPFVFTPLLINVIWFFNLKYLFSFVYVFYSFASMLCDFEFEIFNLFSFLNQFSTIIWTSHLY